MRRAAIVFGALLSVGPALAQAPARQSDLAPAAPTAHSGPDAGNTYHYPPNTGNILAPANRTPYDPAPSGSDAGAKSLSNTGTAAGSGTGR